jgi:hypothetical protein
VVAVSPTPPTDAASPTDTASPTPSSPTPTTSTPTPTPTPSTPTPSPSTAAPAPTRAAAPDPDPDPTHRAPAPTTPAAPPTAAPAPPATAAPSAPAPSPGTGFAAAFEGFKHDANLWTGAVGDLKKAEAGLDGLALTGPDFGPAFWLITGVYNALRLKALDLVVEGEHEFENIADTLMKCYTTYTQAEANGVNTLAGIMQRWKP